MSRKKAAKPYWEMTTEELREATEEFDEEVVADQAEPLNPEMQARWDRAQAKPPGAEKGPAEQTIAVRVDKALLERCSALAKKKRISRDALIARGLKALLAAEGEV
jgi:predicted HicB family RNase H-like nuclease